MGKRASQGDILAAVRQLRRVAVQLDSLALILNVDYSDVAPRVKLDRIRKPTDLLTSRIIETVEKLEATPAYIETHTRKQRT